MLLHRLLVYLLFAAFLVPSLSAEELDLAEPLTLPQCIDIALQYSSTIRNAQTSVELNQLSVKDAKAGYLPDISVAGRYQFSDQIDFGWEESNYNASVSTSYLIWDHGQRESSVGQAKANQLLSEAGFERIKLGLILDVTRSYYNLLKSRELIQVDMEILEQFRENTNRVRALVETGSLIQADVANAELNEATRELTLLNDQNALDVAMATLPTLLGLDPGTLVNVVEEPTYEAYISGKPLAIFELTVEEAIQKALEQRPERTEIQARFDSLDWSLNVARLQRWPRLTATYDYNVFLDDYLREREDFKQHRSWQALATLNFPLFDGGRTKRQVEKLEKQRERELEDAAALERSIALEVRQAYLELRRAEKALEIATKRVTDAEMSLEVTRERFNQELIILLELMDAQNSYAQALTSRVSTFYDHKISESQLKKAMGEVQ